MSKSLAWVSGINPLVKTNILGGERNLWDIGNRRYLAMKKVTLSGSLQTQMRPEEERDSREYLIELESARTKYKRKKDKVQSTYN